MKNKNSKVAIYLFLILLVAGVIYTACKDITPKQEVVEKNIELKLTR
jgi:hypothetical protein